MNCSFVFRVLWAFFLLVFSGFVHAALNDTGITTCSDATHNNLPCPVAGFPGQDAEFGTNGFDFTKLDASGNALPVSTTNHVCVRDNVTGLIWEVKTDDSGLRDKDWTYTWYDSNPATNGGAAGTASGGKCYATGRCDTEKYVQDVNTAGLCGFHDWRMPTPNELLSIVDNSRYNPSIAIGYFPNTLSSSFWSSSPGADGSYNAWGVNFSYGDVYDGSRSSALAVRLVRGGQ
ncbi:exported hypothetical protein [Gammaproteobacteria bacterium]